jgi:hypothetical protein
MAGYHPAVTGATPMTMPMAQITYRHVASYPWGSAGTAAYQEMQPLWTPDGGVICGVPAGSWGNTYAAGRP